MATLIWIYIALYVIVSTAIVLVESFLTPPEERDPPWESGADYVLLALGLAGMLLFQFDTEPTALTTAWRIVAPLLVLSHLVLTFRGRQRVLEAEAPATGSVRLNDLATLAFLGPSLAINLAYAWG